MKMSSPENPPRLGDPTGVRIRPRLQQAAAAAAAGSDETPPRGRLPSMQLIYTGDSTTGGISTDVVCQSAIVGEESCGIAEGSVTEAGGSSAAPLEESKMPVEVLNCEEEEEKLDEGGKTHLVVAPTWEEAPGENVRVLTENRQSREVSPLEPPSTVLHREVLHALSLDEHRTTLPKTASPGNGGICPKADSFHFVSGIHGEGLRRHRDARNSSDGEKAGHAGCVALAATARNQLPTGGDTTKNVKEQERGQAGEREDGREKDKDENKSTAGGIDVVDANSAEELEVVSAAQKNEEAMEQGGTDVVAEGEDSGYRGDAAYAGLLIAEHLELYFRQQVSVVR